MKYGITGHSKNIGLALFKKLAPNVVGFSRSNNYDINTDDSRVKILNRLEDCDVFINNAFNGFGQCFLLLEYFNRFKHTNKTIVNIGSDIANDDFVLRDERLLYYQMEKKALKNLVFDLKKLNYPLNIVYVSFHAVATIETIKQYSNHNLIMTSLDDAVNTIINAAELKK